MIENQVRKYRKLRGLSLAGLAAKSGLAKSTIGDVERGAEPGIVTAANLAKALGTTVYRLWPTVFGSEK